MNVDVLKLLERIEGLSTLIEDHEETIRELTELTEEYAETIKKLKNEILNTCSSQEDRVLKEYDLAGRYEI